MMAEPKYTSSHPVLVSDLSPVTDERKLMLYFKDYGLIHSVRIMKDQLNRSKLFGYVNFVEQDDAHNAAVSMNRRKIDSSRITTKLQSSRSTQQKEKTNYQPLTDCFHFQKGDCQPQNNKPCPYRHKKISNEIVCRLWQNDNCKNVDCIYLHPRKNKGVLPSRTEVKTAINPYSALRNPTVYSPFDTLLKEGMNVEVQLDEKKHHGVIKWIGVIPSFSNDDKLVGVELENAIDIGTDGTFQSQRFFNCADGFGIFVKDTKCKISSRPLLNKNDKVPSRKQCICGYYLLNICMAGDKCALIHPPINSPFTWCYKLPNDSQYNFCSADLNAKIEKSYSNPESDKFALGDTLELNFEDMDACVYKSECVSFKRYSTKSVVVAENEPQATEWKWYWLDDNRKWTLYEAGKSAGSEVIEKEYQTWMENDTPKQFKFSTLQFPYKITFSKMIQTNLDARYRTKRSIRRRPVFKVTDGRRTSSSSSTTAASSESMTGIYPSHWPTSMALSGYQILPANANTRAMIERKFAASMDTRMHYIIISIEEVCNKEFYSKYVSKKQMMQQKSSDVNEQQLWHGTDHKNIEYICHQNFDWRLTERCAYGMGSYFAKDASYSHAYATADANNIYHMFLADVLVGDFVKGSHEYKRPPEKEKFMLYDSCVDNVTDPTKFVIFERDQYYPRYILKYKRKL